MRVPAFFAAAVLALTACGPSTTMEDVVVPFDSGQPMDVARDVQQTQQDSNVSCEFVPGESSTTCRTLHQTCTTGPITCPDGTTMFANATCECQSVQMFGQVWRCDNFCPSASDGGTE